MACSRMLKVLYEVKSYVFCQKNLSEMGLGGAKIGALTVMLPVLDSSKGQLEKVSEKCIVREPSIFHFNRHESFNYYSNNVSFVVLKHFLRSMNDAQLVFSYFMN